MKYPAPTPALKDAADQVEVRKAFSDLSRVLEKKIVGEKTGSDPARGLYVEYTEGPNAQEIAAPGTIPIRDDNGALAGNITGNAPTATLAANATNAVNATAADTVATANEAVDTTCFPLFVPSATGQQEPKTNADLTFDSATGVLGALGLTLPNGTSGNIYWELTPNGRIHQEGWTYITGDGTDTNEYVTVTLPVEMANVTGLGATVIGVNTGNPTAIDDTTSVTTGAWAALRILSSTQISVGGLGRAAIASGARVLIAWWINGTPV